MTDPASDSMNGPKPAEEPVIGADLEAAISAQEAEAEARAEAEATPGGSGIHHWAGVVELRFTQLMVAVMTCLVLASAITRSIGRPQSWTVDMALLTFAWAVFVGADVALRNGRMVNIDLVIARLPSKVRAVVNLFNAVLIIVFLAAMVGLGAWLSYTTRDRSFSGLPWLSYTWVTLAVPVGCALMLWTSLRNWGRQVEEFRAPESGPLTKRGRTVAAAEGEGVAL